MSASIAAPRPRHAAGWVVLLLVAALFPVLGASPTAVAAPTDPPTYVSLTFDDGTSDQMEAAAIAKAHGMPMTFYVNSGSTDQSGYLTKAQLTALAADGNEIGGHSLNHPDLAALPADEVKRQICIDRSNLTAWGFAPRSFAYPFASMNDTVKAAAQECGYNSARNLGDITSRFGCPGCPSAETVPPASAYETKALDQVDPNWTLADLQDAVTRAENSGGGWVQFTFHTICETTCNELSVRSTLFSQFLDWLQPRAAAENTTVRTVGDVIGGAVKPVVTVPPPNPITDPSGLPNPGFENRTPAGAPVCWQAASFGVNTSAYSSPAGRTGSYSGQVAVSNYTDGDGKWLPSLDLGSCSPRAVSGQSYVLRSWYRSTDKPQYAVYLRTTGGSWQYWTTSPDFVASPTTWAPAVWTTPAIPAGFDGISFGLSNHSNGTVTSDDYSVSSTTDTPVTSATVAPAAPDGLNGWYRTRAAVTLSVIRGSETAVPEYSTDGATWTTVVGGSPVQVPDGTFTWQYRSRAGSALEAARSLALKVDTVKPLLTATFDPNTRRITAAATDATSGAGAIEMRVGTGAWTAYNPAAVLGPAAATVELRVADLAGNVSDTTTLLVPPALISGSTVAPANPDGNAGWYRTKPRVTLTKTSGTATAVLEYQLDDGGWTAYTTPVEIPDGTHTLGYRTRDGSVVETPQSRTFKVDSANPTVTATMDRFTRKVNATATDATSGVSSIEHRVGGGAWAGHTGSITVGDARTVVEFRATDQAGNVSGITSVTVPATMTTSLVIAPAAPDGRAGWYVNAPKFSLVRTSGEASNRLEYQIGSGAWTTWTAPVALPDGSLTVRFRQVDGAVVETTRARDFLVDTTAPTVTSTYDAATRKVNVTATDKTSGVDRIEQRINGGAWTPWTGPRVLGSPGEKNEFRAIDKAGNVSGDKTPGATITAPEKATTSKVTLRIKPSRTTAGRHKVRVIAKVKALDPAYDLTGQVQLLANGRVVATRMLNTDSSVRVVFKLSRTSVKNLRGNATRGKIRKVRFRVTYAGSTSVAASHSKVKVLRIRR